MARKKKNTGPKRPIDETLRTQILELHQQNYSNRDISGHLGLDTRQVNGVVSTAQKTGRLNAPAAAPSAPGAPLPAPPPVAQQPAPPADDFTGGAPVIGGGGDGWASPTSQIRYLITRTIPPDGMVGTHHGTFSRTTLAETYGAGTYLVQRFEPGKPIPTEYNEKVSEAYGPPKVPDHTRKPGASAHQSSARPGAYRGERPWMRSGAQPATDESARREEWYRRYYAAQQQQPPGPLRLFQHRQYRLSRIIQRAYQSQAIVPRFLKDFPQPPRLADLR